MAPFKNDDVSAIAEEIGLSFWLDMKSFLNESYKFCFKGLWLFKYNLQLSQLETWRMLECGPKGKNKVLFSRTDDDEINAVKIPKGEGSIGYVIGSGKKLFLEDVASDPRGVVSSIDKKIKQKSAFLVPIRLTDNEGSPIICVLDIFFSYDKFNKSFCDRALSWKMSPQSINLLRVCYQREELTHKFNKICKPVGATDYKDDAKIHSELVGEVQSVLKTVVSVPLISYKPPAPTASVVKIDVDYFKRLFLNELHWCCYCKPIPANCLLSGVQCAAGACGDSSCGPVVKLMWQVYGDSGKVDKTVVDLQPGAKLLLFSRGKNIGNSKGVKFIQSLFSPIITELGSAGLSRARRKLLGDMVHLLSEMLFSQSVTELKSDKSTETRHKKLGDVAYLAYQKSFCARNKMPDNILEPFDSLKSQGLKEYVSDDCVWASVAELEIVGMFVLRPPDAAWVCEELVADQISPDTLQRLKKKLKLPSSIKPIYSALLTNDIKEANRLLDNYPPAVTVDGPRAIRLRDVNGGRELEFDFKESESRVTWRWNNYSGKGKLDLLCGYVDPSLVDNEVSQLLATDAKTFQSIASVMGCGQPISGKPSAGNKGLAESFSVYPKGKLFPKDEEEVGAHISRITSVYETAIQRRKALEHGRKSAVAAIMARNMSHNIGSHVLNYLATKENKFYGYLRDKMNFLTEIVTSAPVWGVGMGFLQDVVEPFVGLNDPQYTEAQVKLLDNIFRSEHPVEHPITDLQVEYHEERCNPVRVNWKSENGSVSISKAYLNAIPANKTDPGDEYKNIRIPHGVIGCHAFYSFMEGFIRNSAKHNRSALSKLCGTVAKQDQSGIGASPEKFVVKITLDWDPKDESKDPEWFAVKDRYARLRISDNVSKFDDCVAAAHGKKEKLCKVENKCDCAAHAKSCQHYINDLLVKGSLVKDSGEIIDKAWGLKELLMCAEWLSGARASGSGNCVPAFGGAGADAVRGPRVLQLKQFAKNEWGWEMYLLKPQKILFVGPAFSAYSQKEEKGIYWDKTLEDLTARINGKHVAHTLVVLDGTDKSIRKWIENKGNILWLPQRVLVLTNGELNTGYNRDLKWIPIKESDLSESLDTLYGDLYGKVAEWVNRGKAAPGIRVLIDISGNPEMPEPHKAVSKILKIGLDGNAEDEILFTHDIDASELKGKYRYVEGFAKGVSAVYGRLISAAKDNSACRMLQESSLLKVIVIDERLFNDVDATKKMPHSQDVALHAHWLRMGVEFVTFSGSAAVITKNEEIPGLMEADIPEEAARRGLKKCLGRDEAVTSAGFSSTAANTLSWLNELLMDKKVAAKLAAEREVTELPIEIQELLSGLPMLEEDKVIVLNTYLLEDKYPDIMPKSRAKLVSFKKFVADKRGQAHFISIHQAIISDVIKKDWNKGVGSVVKGLEEIANNVIIHSARGDVGISEGHKFIDYSNLRNVLIDQPDKHALADRLMSISGEGGK